jgi:hypothetical protein
VEPPKVCFDFITSPATNSVKAFKAITAGAAIAAGLYLLRRTKLMIDGMLELNVLIPFAASVYVPVRGLDNFIKAGRRDWPRSRRSQASGDQLSIVLLGAPWERAH